MKSFDLRLVDEDDGLGSALSSAAAEPRVRADGQGEPQIFVRAVATPAGWPWDQTRGAELAARHEAPLPIALVHLRLKRLTPWRPNQSATFAACYIRAAEVRERMEAEVEVEGRRFPVMFEAPEVRARRARWSLAMGGGVAAAVALLIVSVAGALVARGQAEDQLAAMERDVAVKLRWAEAAERTRRESAALAAVAPGERTGAALTDLAWAAAARDPDARIEAWRWDHGAASVRARGEVSPFIDPSRPAIREGANLWRIGLGEGEQ